MNVEEKRSRSEDTCVVLHRYVITKPDGTGNLTRAHIEREVRTANNFFCGADAASPPHNETKLAISPGFGADGAMCGDKCAAYDPECGMAGRGAQAAKIGRMTNACEADCKRKGNCDSSTSCRVANCYCDTPEYCKKWGTPRNDLSAPRVESGIRFTLESVQYITNTQWHDTCCCTHKGGISYTPTQNEIFDQARASHTHTPPP